MRSTQRIFSSKSRNKRLQCYDNGKKFFDQPTKNDLKTYDNIQKITTGQGDDYTTATGCLLDYPYSKEHYKLIAVNLSK